MVYKPYIQNSLLDKLSRIYSLKREGEIIFSYRIISLSATSILYIMNERSTSLLFKLGVTFILFIEAVIVSMFYLKLYNSKAAIKTLVIIETCGIALLLFATGGLDSPFIWYALNPIFIAAAYLSTVFCYLNLAFYVTTASIIGFSIFDKHQGSFAEIVYENSYVLLVLTLVTIALQLLSNRIQKLKEHVDLLREWSKKLSDTNCELKNSNEQYKESMEYIMSLYQLMEAFNTQNNIGALPGIIAEYAAKFTKCQRAFFLSSPLEDDNKIFIECYPESDKDFESTIKRLWNDVKIRNIPLKINIGEHDFMITGIKSPSKYYGLIGIQLDSMGRCSLNEQHEKELNFLSELSSVIYERYRLQSVSDQLIISEEQKRIANEMHDSVSQRMFGIVCSIHAVMNNIDEISHEELESELNLIKNSANTAMQELRMTIYHLRSKDKDEKKLFSCIKSLLIDLEGLNKIKIDFNSCGDEDLISQPIKKAIYRIICEAAGNAIRHGKCDSLEVSLSISTESMELSIKDNGSGFSPKGNNSRGLGLNNMNSLVRSYYGSIDIKSQMGQGTQIRILIPNGLIYEKSQGGIT